MSRVLVTGANGFIGSRLVAELHARGMQVNAAARCSIDAPQTIRFIRTDAIDATTDWREALAGCQAVVHLAARVHVMHDSSSDPSGEFRRVNVEGTLRLAQQAEQAGVRRFVFVSSIKVNGDSSPPGRGFTEKDPPQPVDAYGSSKAEAEKALLELARSSSMEVVVIRPPLVYGPGVKANFLSMTRWLKRGVPLPLGAFTTNKRSLVAVDNLIDFIATCIDHPAAGNEVFLVADGEDLSTADLLRRTAAAMQARARLIPVPLGIMKTLAQLLGRSQVMKRLGGTLQVDTSKARERLGWRPPVSVDDGLRRAVQATSGAR